MSDVIDRPILEQEKTASTRLRIIDCDVHPSIHAHSDLNEFLPKRWQEHLKTYGSHLRTPYIGTTPYPRSSPLIARRDAWPPTGGPPGSDLAFMRSSTSIRSTSSSASCRCSTSSSSRSKISNSAPRSSAPSMTGSLPSGRIRDPRLKASILVGQDDTALAIAEIERCAKTGEYIQINVCRAPTSRSAAAATGRSTLARRNSACRSASMSAAMAATPRPAAAGRPIIARSISRTRIPWPRSSPASCWKASPSASRN